MLEFLVGRCGGNKKALLVARDIISSCSLRRLAWLAILKLVLHVPSGQATDYPRACYGSMADWYDVL